MFSLQLLFALSIVPTVRSNLEIAHRDEVHLRNPRQLTFGGVHSNPALSSDGRFLIFAARDVAGKRAPYGHQCDQLYYLDLQLPIHEPRLVSNRFGTFASGVFFPSDRSLVATSDVHNYEPLDRRGSDETCSNPSDELLNSTTVGANFDLYHMDVHKSYRPYRLTWNLPRTSSVEVAMSPNRTLAFVSVDEGGNRKLWLMKADGSPQRQPVAHDFDFVATPAFSADGTQLAFYGRPAAGSNSTTPSFGIYVIQLGNRTDVRRVHELTAVSPSFHLNGQKVFVSAETSESTNSTGPQVFLLDLVRVGAEQITYSGVNSFPLMSPTASHLVWVSSRNSSESERNLFAAGWIENPNLNKRKWFSEFMSMVWDEDKKSDH